MSSDVRIAILALGALLLLAALFGRRLFGENSGTLRAAIAVAGAAALGWGILPWLTPRPSAPAVAAPLVPVPAATAPAPAAADLVRVATLGLEECQVASAPAVPDASRASKSEMLTARAAFQAYDAATNRYLQCVDAAIDSVRKSNPEAPAADLQALKTLGTSAHNTAIDQEQAVADQLNAQVRAFKAKHPGG